AGTVDPVVRINGLSKMAAAPEVKLGWVAVTGGDADVRRALVDDLDTRHDAYLTVSGFAEACATVFLTDSAGVPAPDSGGPWLETVRDTVNRQRAAFDRYLTEIPSLEDVRHTVWRGGIHRVLRIDPTVAAMRFGTLDDETIAIRILTETGVLVHPGYLYGMDVAEFASGPWFVVSSLNTEDVLASAVSRLHLILR
ncbi:MAG: hypothetical protein PF508_02030, partial [Spirochaeta sp.]|nr:hypothetical protein [Spirochaeta sp.]